jgi:hypothetical protein
MRRATVWSGELPSIKLPGYRNATVQDFDEQVCPITLVYGFAACIEFVV